MLKLYNSRTKSKEEFIPREDDQVKMYSCGPTVYDYVHIGNLRAFTTEDILYRVLKYKGHNVKYIMNITDVGHLTDDADQGKDKMEQGSRREGKSAEEIAEFYTKAFKKDVSDLNILPPDKWPIATEHIEEMINLVQKLIDKGYTYETSDGIYFDTTKLDDYGKLANLEEQDLDPGARVEMKEKKNKHDFALWKFSPEDKDRQMEWKAFEKMGFPGWHIECSAMSMEYLGEQFDIHWGGVDHIPVHHTNEIAQSEAATSKKPWVNFWMHVEFLQVKDEKMSKSKNNFVTMKDIKNKSIEPLAFRYFLLQSHYRKELNFTRDALKAAEKGLKKLRRKTNSLDKNKPGDPKLEEEFMEAINDDLNTAEALSVLWKGFEQDRISRNLISKFDKILGLDLLELKEKEVKIPEEVQELLEMRAEAREAGNWERSDKLRAEIKAKGYEVRDTEEGQKVSKK
ncbi:MAG: cysteine--tRNA ligase [Candidatus Magasanikbacteria bacterium]